MACGRRRSSSPISPLTNRHGGHEQCCQSCCALRVWIWQRAAAQYAYRLEVAGLRSPVCLVTASMWMRKVGRRRTSDGIQRTLTVLGYNALRLSGWTRLSMPDGGHDGAHAGVWHGSGCQRHSGRDPWRHCRRPMTVDDLLRRMR